MSILFQYLELPLRSNKVMNLSELHHEKPELFLLSCSGLLIFNLERVYNWVGCF